MDGNHDEVVVFMVFLETTQNALVYTTTERLHGVFVGVEYIFGGNVEPITLCPLEHQLSDMVHLDLLAQLSRILCETVEVFLAPTS